MLLWKIVSLGVLSSLASAECPVAPTATCTLRTGPIAEPSTQTTQVARRIPSGRRADRGQITCLKGRTVGSGVPGGNVWSHVQVRAVQGCSQPETGLGCARLKAHAGAPAHSSSGGAAPVALGADTAIPTQS